MKPAAKSGPASEKKYFCPGCGFAMEQGDDFCYHCKKFVDWEQGRVRKPEEVTDSMLDSLILRSSMQSQTYQQEAEIKKYKTGVIFIIIGVVLFITLILFLVGLIFIAVGVVKVLSVKNAPKGCLTPEEMSSVLDEYIVLPVLRESFDRVEEYHHDRGISTITIHKIQLMQKPYNKTEGSDYIRAVHRGVPFERSDTILTREYQKTGGIPASELVFRGSFLIVPLKLSLPEDVTVWEQNPSGSSFEEKYHAESRHPETADSLLTPERKRLISQLDDAADGQITLKFMQDGFLCIANASDRDLFQTSDQEKSAAAIRERFRQEAASIGRVMTLLSDADICKMQSDM